VHQYWKRAHIDRNEWPRLEEFDPPKENKLKEFEGTSGDAKKKD